MRPTFRSLIAALAACILFALLGCLLDDKQAGRRGSEVENEVYGVLVAVDGSPVTGARVKAIPYGAPVAGDTGIVFTGKDGAYSFRGLAAGTYNLHGDYDSGSLVVLIPAVDHIDTLVRDSVGIDTLRAPGRIRGRLLQGDRGFGRALAYIPGTSYLAVSDDSGWFMLSGIPQGRYAVQYSAAGFLVAPDTGIFVPSGVTVELPAKRLRYDPALPPPEPHGLSAAFDTLRGRATLTWHPVEVSDLDGYLVYRDQPGMVEPQLVEGAFVRDTVFTDSGLGDPAKLPGGPLVYRVKSRDKGANRSILYSESAVAASAPRSRITTAIDWLAPAPGVDTIALGDSLRLIAAYANPTRRNVLLAWRQSGLAEPLAMREVSGLAGFDTLDWRAATEGEAELTLSAKDAGGAEWPRSRMFHIVRNSLVAQAGPDTTVTLGDSAVLTAAARSRFGRYSRWEWDVGATGAFIPAAPGATRIRVPVKPGDLRCVLRVVDAFGDTAKDTTLIHVLADRPMVEAAGDTTVSLGDSVRVFAAASDKYGKVVKYEWRVCSDTAFRESAATAWLKMPRVADPACPVYARVTDDDGQSAEDTLRVRILADPPQAEAMGDTTVSLGDSVRVTGKGTDKFGRIVKWEWKAGAAGEFKESGPNAYIPVARIAGPGFPLTLRVTDDDGQTAQASLRVNIVADPPKAEAIGADTVSLNDSIRLEAKGQDGYGRIVGWEWACGAGAPFVKAGPGLFYGKAVAVATAEMPCILRVTDDDSLTALDTAWFMVVKDPPKAVASASRYAGTPGDAVRLSSAGSADGFGTIAGREWDIGAKGAFKPAGPDTNIILPAITGALRCILRVTDDDGQTDLDTVELTVSLDPKTDAGRDTTVIPGTRVNLRGKVLAGFGIVSKWEWDIGATGTFRRTATGDTSFALAMGAPSFRCVLRATNAAGYSGNDTMWVRMATSGSMDYEAFRMPAALDARVGAAVTQFQGKLWLFGGAKGSTPGLNDIWSSDDGLAWTLRGNAAWPPRWGHKVVEYAGRLWMLGGTDNSLSPDGTDAVWSSADGLKWDKVNVRTPFTKRFQHSAFVFKGKLCVIGGQYLFDSQETRATDMWVSQDGIDWETLGTWTGLYYHDVFTRIAVVADGSLLAIDGKLNMWTTKDGIEWNAKPIIQDSAMSYPSSVALVGDEVWIMAAKPDITTRAIWKLDVAAAKASYTVPPFPKFQYIYEGFFQEFRGAPWIWNTHVWDDNFVSHAWIYRPKR